MTKKVKNVVDQELAKAEAMLAQIMNEPVKFDVVLAEVLDGEKGAFESDMTKEEWLIKSDVVLTRAFGNDWTAFPTFNPEGDGNEKKPTEHKQVNRIRLAVQASRKARLVAKYAADDKGNPLRGNPHAYWNELKGKHKELQDLAEALAQAQAETGETGETGEKETRAKKALKAEDFRFGCEGMQAHMTYCAVHPEAVQSPADTDKELNDLIRRALNRMKELKVDLPPRAKKAN